MRTRKATSGRDSQPSQQLALQRHSHQGDLSDQVNSYGRDLKCQSPNSRKDLSSRKALGPRIPSYSIEPSSFIPGGSMIVSTLLSLFSDAQPPWLLPSNLLQALAAGGAQTVSFSPAILHPSPNIEQIPLCDHSSRRPSLGMPVCRRAWSCPECPISNLNGARREIRPVLYPQYNEANAAE